MTYIENSEFFRDGYAFGTVGADTTVRFDTASDFHRRGTIFVSNATQSMTHDMSRAQVAGLRDALDHWLRFAPHFPADTEATDQ